MRSLFLACFFLIAQAYSQVIVTEQSEGKSSLVITRMDFNVKTVGFLAETEVTMTFANPNNGDMIGNFYLPIPENSRVSSYALDVKGVLIDAVAVEKIRARQVFEAITRRRVDPGLLEWSKGNNFKTRVYPIPGRGTRTIQVKILTEMKKSGEGFLYKFPLKFKDPTNILTLNVKSFCEDKPTVTSEDFKDISFSKEKDNSYSGLAKKFKLSPPSIEILFPDKQKEWQYIHEDKDKTLYYLWAKEVKPLNLKRDVGKSITLFWDASHSRNSSDRKKELEVLKGICAKFKEKTVIKLIVFRESFEPAKNFDIIDRNSDKLTQYLSTVQYDGGTLIDSSMIYEAGKAGEEIMIFSDGLSTLSNFKSSKDLQQHVTIFNSSDNLDKLLFDRILVKNKGKFINLNNSKTEEAVERFFGDDAQFDARGRNYIEQFPRNDQSISGLFVRTGLLNRSEQIETFSVDFKNAIEDSFSYSISRNDRKGSELIKSFFLIKKLDSLLIEGNEQRILEHGLNNHLSTPFTSMIVLENYWDYVRYNIEPPESMPKWREDFLSRPPVKNENFKPSKKHIITQAKRRWSGFLNWFKTDYEYPENFAWQKSIFIIPDYMEAGLLEVVETRTAEGIGGSGADLVGGLSETGGSDGPMESDPFAEDDPFADPLDDPPADDKKVGEIETVSIVKKEWDEGAPEFLKMKASEDPYGAYLVLKKQHGHTADFYLTSAKVLHSIKKIDEARRVAGNCAELMGNNVSYLRKLAFSLSEMKFHKLAARVYKMVLEERPDEPQSWRDLAMSYAAGEEYRKAVVILNNSLSESFERFEMKSILILDLNRVLTLAASKNIKLYSIVDPALVKEIQMDVRAVLTWNADNYDINMSVVEPSGEVLSYAGYTSTIGGLISHDFNSYGPEQYLLKKAMSGNYKFYLKAGSDRTQEVVGDVICRLDIYTDFGSKDEYVSSHYFKFDTENQKHELSLNIGIKEGKKKAGLIPEHIVLSPFDSLLSVAAKMKNYGFNWAAVKAANPDIDWSELKSGTKVKVPAKN